MPDVTADYLAFRREAGAVELPRDFVAAEGPDVVPFLQGQLSQNIDLGTGESTWALLLQPQGKMVAFLRVLRVAGDRFVLETDAGFGPAVIERLNRFKLRVKCDLSTLDWTCLAVRGPQAHEATAGAAASAGAAATGSTFAVVAD